MDDRQWERGKSMAILFTDDRFLEHDTGNHPESAERLRAIHRRLKTSDLLQKFSTPSWKPATTEQIERVHTPQHLDQIRRFAQSGGGRVERDTIMSRRSFDTALLAAGAAVAAVDHLFTGKHRRAVSLSRPPGHHALKNSAMGFCLFNNVAVAAAHAMTAQGVSRILIVDWDVHHGNGTQALFDADPHVFFFSAHRHPFYPGTGTADETGSGRGLGTMYNLPLPFGITRADYHSQFQQVLQQVARRCRPELVLISAGFDAHTADPIGSLGLESEDFGKLTEHVGGVADEYAEGRLVSLLEGGYNVDALAESVECHLEALAAASDEPP